MHLPPRIRYTDYRFSAFATIISFIAAGIAFVCFCIIRLSSFNIWSFIICLPIAFIGLFLSIVIGKRMNRNAFLKRLTWDVFLYEEVSSQNPELKDYCIKINSKFRDKCLRDELETRELLDKYRYEIDDGHSDETDEELMARIANEGKVR